LDAGDFSARVNVPTEKEIAQERLLMETYKDMGYNAVAVGTMDLPYLSSLPDKRPLLLSLNLQAEKPVWRPYEVFELKGIKVVVTALTQAAGALDLISVLQTAKNPGRIPDSYKILDPVTVFKEQLPMLKAKGDIVIVLSNLGGTADFELAQNVPGIDLIIESGPMPPINTPKQVGNTYILKAHNKGQSIGVATLSISDKKLTGLTNRLEILASDLPSNEALERRIEALPK